MNKFLVDLNAEQLQAVLYTEGPLAIIAAAGSGKTRVITHKIAYLVDELKVKPWRVLAVTFTNKATREMKARVIKMVGIAGESVHVFTYHSLCARILREEISYYDYPKSFVILDAADQKQVLNGVYKKLDITSKTVSYNAASDFISRQKMQHNTFAQVIDSAQNDTEKMLGQIYKLYALELERIKALDFDDLLLFVHRLFREHPEAKAKWASKYDYVLIDEFQDTSFVQYEIIKSLIHNDRLTIVGDPDQTIYSWRKADVSLINNFQKHFSNAKIILLETNYRSTKTILEKANTLIQHNTRRIDKKLRATISEGDEIAFYHGFSDDDEARWIARNIVELKKKRAVLRDVAILYRANYLSASIEKALITENINYVIWGGIGFYQRAEIKDALAFLKVINNGDEVSLRRMINIPPRKIGLSTTDMLFNESEERGVSLWTLLNKHLNTVPLGPLQRSSLEHFVQLIKKYHDALANHKFGVVIEKFLIEVGYISTLSLVTDLSKLENLKELVKILTEWQVANPTKTLNDYLEEASLYVDREQVINNDYVTLMTVHTSKGLEFDNVFIAGFAESVFPSVRALEEGENGGGLEEERRLAYVAITRAKKRLFISDSRGYALDHNYQKKPSRFLKEMGINVRDFTSEYIAPNAVMENYVKEDRNIIAGDEVQHVIFGTGVVVSVQGELIDIAFRGPHGVKTLMKNHKSLQKVGAS